MAAQPGSAPPTAWLEVSVTVNGEMAEAVAEALGRFAHQGVALEYEGPPADPDFPPAEPLSSDARIRVRAFLPVDSDLDEKRTLVERALWPLQMIARNSGLTVPAAVFAQVAAADWEQQWRAHYKPMRIGRRILVAPPWETPQLASDAVVVRIDPGQAFGTGTHPTTQLCLAALEDELQPGQRVLDLGCGSGILAIAALLLGAAQATAFDIDPAAVAATIENAAANGVAARMLALRGSLAEAQESAPYPLVLANLLSRIIIEMLQHGLAKILAPGGTLILSGILQEQCADVTAAAALAGLVVKAVPQSGEWVAIVARRTAAAV